MGYSSYTIYIMKSINNNKYLICLSLCACVHVHYLALLLLFYILFKYLCHKKGARAHLILPLHSRIKVLEYKL